MNRRSTGAFIVWKGIKNRVPLRVLDLAAELGFEPRQTESETVVLPLHNSAILTKRISLYRILEICQEDDGQIFPIYEKFIRRLVQIKSPPGGDCLPAAIFTRFVRIPELTSGCSHTAGSSF